MYDDSVSLPEAELVIVAGILAPALRSLRQRTLNGLEVPTDLTADAIRSWLVSLNDEQLQIALMPFERNPQIARALARITSPAPPRSGRSWFVNGRPVVDRHSLFDRLASMAEGTKRVLYVRGTQFSGKTYSKFVVQDFAQQSGHQYADIDLIGALSLEAVLEQTRSWLQPQSPAPTFAANQSTEDNWARSCAQHVFTSATSANATRDGAWWLVFDHFDQAKPTTAMIAFFLRLVEIAALQRPSSSMMRLVLIDHSVPSPLSARQNSVEDLVRFPGEDDVREFYRATSNLKEADIEAKVTELWKALATVEKPDWMRTFETLL